MLLAVDIGNSNTKFGVYDGERLIFKLSIPTIRKLSADDLSKIVGNKIEHPISSAIVSSVVPEIDNAMDGFLNFKFHVNPVFVKNDFDFGLTINYTPLADAGADRLVNTFSAVEKYGAPCIVCSFGTALTIDVVDANRTLIGGLIAPGMNSLATALKITTSKLPEVEIKLPDAVIQTTTIGSIQSGIVFGYFGLVETLILKVKSEPGAVATGFFAVRGTGAQSLPLPVPTPTVIATGGFAKLIAENTTQIDIVEENLLLDGLRRLHARIGLC